MSGYTKPLIHLEFNDTDKTVWNNGQGNISSNTSFGDNALKSNTTGFNNTAIGDEALGSNDEGRFNTAIGVFALYSNTTGIRNSGLGLGALQNNIGGNENTAVGTNAGRYIANGVDANTAPENSIFIGDDSRALTATDTNQIIIGHNMTGRGSNTVIIGNNSTTDNYFNGSLHIATVIDYADNAAALSGGLVVGQVYRTGDILKIVH